MIVFFLKYLHIVSIAASFALFFVRGVWVLRSYPDPQEQWVRAVPYLVDATVALSAALVLMFAPNWPGNWLTVKLALVVVYAGLSHYLFRIVRARAARILVWLVAVLLFLFIMTMSVLRSPLGIFSILQSFP